LTGNLTGKVDPKCVFLIGFDNSEAETKSPDPFEIRAFQVLPR
jgi:hypothetical protein